MNDRKYRNTNQRKVIMDTLKNTNRHPTAIEIYDKIRDQLPQISLGTIYRNLDVLHEQGLIQKIYTGDSQMHYDANVKDHIHIRCLQCDCVRDILVKPTIDYNIENNNYSSFDIIGHNIEFIGICPDCKDINHTKTN